MGGSGVEGNRKLLKKVFSEKKFELDYENSSN
jgi:hypothetical protein